jgi:hypothetical protein
MRLLFSLLFWCCYLLVLAHLVCWPCSCYRSPTGDVPALLLFSPFSCSRSSLFSSCRFTLLLASVVIRILPSSGWCYFLVLPLLPFSDSPCSFSLCPCSCSSLVLAILASLVVGPVIIQFSLFFSSHHSPYSLCYFPSLVFAILFPLVLALL